MLKSHSRHIHNLTVRTTSRKWIAGISAGLALMLGTPASAQTCPFDDGNSQITREGLVLTRFALGLTGAAMVNGTDFTVADAPTIQSNIACPSCGLNITGNVDGGGNPMVTVADATIISRKLAGFQGASLTAGLALGSGTRNTSTAVNSFLLAGCGAGANVNGWVQGGNSFGVAGVLGTNDDQAMTIKSGGALLSAQLADGSGLRIVRTATAGAAASVNGSVRNSIGLTPYPGATVGGGGSDSLGCNDPTTGATRSCGNVAIADWATIAGGRANRATGRHATMGGGISNSALADTATVSGGESNIASGQLATVPGGVFNRAEGFASFAAGIAAVARGNYSFVWSDFATGYGAFDPAAIGSFGATPGNTAPLDNTFIVRATGGVQFISSVNEIGQILTQCFISPGGSGWNCVSDRNVKHAVKAVSPKGVLARLMSVPVSTWAFNGNERRQMGPMAQDFFRAFGLGDSDRSINSVDAQGVAFAAIQGLHQIVKEKDAEIAKLAAAQSVAATLLRDLAEQVKLLRAASAGSAVSAR